MVLAAAVTLLFVCCRSFAVEAVYPLSRAGRFLRVEVIDRVVACFRGAALTAENSRLRQELAALTMLRGDNQRLEAENARLREVLGYVERTRGVWRAASVLSEQGGAAGVRHSLRIDRGSLDGIREGAAVAVSEGLVGRVGEVSPHTAEVLLLTDRSVRVACVVETGEGVRATGILSGGSEEKLELKRWSGAEELPPRARVLTSGQGGVFPKGIEVGTLLAVRKDEQDRVREGEVLPQVDFSSLEDVFIRCEK